MTLSKIWVCQKNLLIFGVQVKSKKYASITFSWYKHCEGKCTSYFTKENFLVYYVDVKGLNEKLGTTYYPTDWRLYINTSKTSLKAVLFRYANRFACIPSLTHSTSMKESYENMEILRAKLQYATHACKISVDFKVVNMLLGKQSRYTKYPCFLCEWNSRD